MGRRAAGGFEPWGKDTGTGTVERLKSALICEIHVRGAADLPLKKGSGSYILWSHLTGKGYVDGRIGGRDS